MKWDFDFPLHAGFVQGITSGVLWGMKSLVKGEHRCDNSRLAV